MTKELHAFRSNECGRRLRLSAEDGQPESTYLNSFRFTVILP